MSKVFNSGVGAFSPRPKIPTVSRQPRPAERKKKKKLITQKNHRLHFSSRIIYLGRRPPVESYPNIRHFVFSRRKKEH